MIFSSQSQQSIDDDIFKLDTDDGLPWVAEARWC